MTDTPDHPAPIVFYRGARQAWEWVTENSIQPGETINGSRYWPLPSDLRQDDANGDNGCCCPYCSSTPGVSADHGPVWDTLAVGRTNDGNVTTAWLVHAPHLHGRRLRRQDMTTPDQIAHDPHPAHDDPPADEPEEEGFTVEQTHTEDGVLVVRILHPKARFPVARLEIRDSLLGAKIDAALGNPAVGVACWYRKRGR